MSGFNDPEYVKEFICRTQMNYFMIQEFTGKSKQKEIENLISYMHQHDYKVELPYEVTQLINCFLGMLVFPKEEYFNKLSWQRGNFNTVPSLGEYVKKLKATKDVDYKNTYKENLCEQKIIIHMRNAVCHDRLSIYPLSRSEPVEISHICFKDKDDKGHTFSLVLPIDLLEEVLLQLNAYLLNQNKTNMNYKYECKNNTSDVSEANIIKNKAYYQFLFELYKKKSAKEVYEYLAYSILPELTELINEIQKLATSERLYGNMKDSALAKIRKAID